MNGNRALEFLQAVYNDEELPLLTRVRVAISCLPFETPKLIAQAQITGDDFATLLDRRIAHYQQLQANGKLIEAKAETQAEPTPPETKPTPLANPLLSLYSNKFRRRF